MGGESRYYRVVGANVFAHSQETILTLGTSVSMVKAMISRCNKTEDSFDLDTNLHTSNIVLLSMFIDLFGSLVLHLKKAHHPW
jgi:hypothetical protein